MFDLSNKWWNLSLWKWHVPLKIKLFCWLSMENKILTGDNYMKKGGIRPNICLLCYKEEENMIHMFHKCPFTKVVWNLVLQNLNIRGQYEELTLEGVYRTWYCDQQVNFH